MSLFVVLQLALLSIQIFVWSHLPVALCTQRHTVRKGKELSLKEIYSSYNDTYGFHHYYNYADFYEENVGHLRHRMRGMNGHDRGTVKIFEIGVHSGGSARVWQRYFGKQLRYVGLDRNPNSSAAKESLELVDVVIGDQMNQTLLAEVCAKYGPFDLIVDDGGHRTAQIITSLRALWFCLTDGGVYAIEDLHLMQYSSMEGMLFEGKDAFDHLADWGRKVSQFPLDKTENFNEFSRSPAAHLKKMVTYDSIVFLHFTTLVEILRPFRTGSFWVEGESLEF